MNAPLRVAVVGACPYPVPQGSQVYLRETALALARAGHDTRLVVYGYGLGEDRSGLPIHRARSLPLARKTKAGPSLVKPLLDLMLVRELRRVCREFRIDAVSAHNYEGLLTALIAGNRPVVYHAHNAMADELPTYFGGGAWARALGRSLDRSLPRRADWCIVPHERLREYLVQCGCPSERVVVVPPAIDAITDSPESDRTSGVDILYTGNLDSYQNLPLLTVAMERVRSRFPAAQLRIVSNEGASGAFLESADWVQHEHASTDEVVREALARDAIFVCPRVSWSGYPMKLLNAMSAGLPIVCCASSAHPLTHGHNACVVPDNDPEAFAQAIAVLLENSAERRRLGANARDSWERNHCPETFSARLDAVYRQAVAR